MISVALRQFHTNAFTHVIHIQSKLQNVLLVVSEFVGDRSTRVFSGHGFVDFSQVVVDNNLQQIIVGVR